MNSSDTRFFLSGLIGAINRGIDAYVRAYDRRTVVIAHTSGNIDQAEIDQITAQIKAEREAVQQAIDTTKG